MSKEGSQHKVNNILSLLLTKDQNTVWWSLVLMFLEDILQHFESYFDLTLPLDHCVQDKVHDGQKGTDFLIGKAVFDAEIIVDHMEFED